MTAPGADRVAVLMSHLGSVQERIARAVASAGRDPASVHLIAVTKTWPSSDVRALAGLGLRDFGENKDQEAATKAAALVDLDLRWHLVGRLQRNKVRSVVRYAAVVHSVDRVELASALGTAAERGDRRLTALIQVSLDDDPTRGGVAIERVAALAEVIHQQDGLILGGVMAVAPREVDPARAFARLREVADQLQTDHPDATMISAGMSEDLEAAIDAGATHLRIGAALLGQRPTLG